LEEIRIARIPAEGFRSKSWDEFAKPDAPKFDFIFTVCDNAANEVCPMWPGHPMTAHWGIPDPAVVKGTPEEIQKAFRSAFLQLDIRVGLFLSLPLESIDRLELQDKLDEIGRQ
jgi:arsenate reductase